MTPDAPLASETLSEPVVPVNEPEAATLPPPLPQLESGELPADGSAHHAGADV